MRRYCDGIIGNRGEITINPRMTMMKELGLLGLELLNGAVSEMEAIMKDLVGGLARPSLRPIIGRKMPLADVAKAHEAVLEPGAHRKIVLVP